MAALVVAFATAESLTERYVFDHSRLAGTARFLTQTLWGEKWGESGVMRQKP
jgi:hypothetical protein